MKGQATGKMPPKDGVLHQAILYSLAVTLVISAMASFFQNHPTLIAFEEKIGIRPYQYDVGADAEKFIDGLSGLNPDSQRNFINQFIAPKSPVDVTILVKFLLSKKEKKTAGPAAVLLSNRAAIRYKDNYFLIMSAREYLSGISLEQDFQKSKLILDLPSLQNNATADYYRGLWWSDASNPERDIEKAIFYLKNAIAGGVESAEIKLKAIEAEN